MRSDCICLTIPGSSGGQKNKAAKKKTWRTALCCSLVLHVLLFSEAIRIGNSQAVYEPVQIEVELGITPDSEQQRDTGPKTAAPRTPITSPVASPLAKASLEVKHAVATPAAPAPPAPAVVQQEPKVVSAAALPASMAPSREPANNDSRLAGARTATPAAQPHAAPGGNGTHTEASATPGTLPYVIDGPRPAYPADARAKGWTGKVRVRVLISEQGTVKDAVIAAGSGHASLDEAALTALRRWLFHPAYRDGRPVAAWVGVPVSFKLN